MSAEWASSSMSTVRRVERGFTTETCTPFSSSKTLTRSTMPKGPVFRLAVRTFFANSGS